MPAINQGQLVIQFRSDRSELLTLFSKIVDRHSASVFDAERGVVSVLKGDCKSSVSVYAAVTSRNTVALQTRVMLPDGSETLEASAEASFEESFALGQRVGQELIARGAEQLLERSRAMAQA